MSRTSEDDVRTVVKSDTTIDLSPFIEAASVLVDRVDSQDSDGIMTAKALRELETWLAAHFYAIRDGQYASKKTGDASANFQVGAAGSGPFELNDWGRTAMALDLTGTLSDLNQQAKQGKQVASLIWFGTDYD